MRFTSSAGLEIAVGRNNVQNEQLTHREAFKTDVWLHAQKIPGSHVIIKTNGGEADGVTLGEAAALAAWFSQAREGGKVAVDWTLVKYVKKMPGGRPGMVTYTDYKTIVAVPDEALVERLKKK
jgi:predicted ribosome quality control (RQC) complex YloA/Tae2 family protein